MIAYFDTSALIPLVVDEPGSEIAGRIWDDADRVVSSRLVVPESRAALAQAYRMGRLSPSQMEACRGDLNLLVAQLDLVEITADVATRAGDLAETLALRAYDAVHLASAEAVSDRDLVVAGGDDALLAAAAALGLATANTGGGEHPHPRR